MIMMEGSSIRGSRGMIEGAAIVASVRVLVETGVFDRMVEVELVSTELNRSEAAALMG